jgi:TatD DNase family protein
MYVDVHCHLDLLKYIEREVEKAREVRVEEIWTNGVNSETNKKALILARQFKEVKAFVGIYPDDALKMTDLEIDREIEFIKENKENIKGIGEVGMDFKDPLKKEDKEKQEKVFRKFIKLSLELGMPITVHSRKAERECIEILEDMKTKRVVMHYFSGKLGLVERIVENGWFLSIPTCVKYSEQFQKVVEKVPIENILCETDSPFSHPNKKFPNNPGNVIESYKKIAEIKNIKIEEVEKIIEENVKKISK